MTADSFEPAVLKTIPNATLNATMAEGAAVVMAEEEAAVKVVAAAAVKVAAAAAVKVAAAASVKVVVAAAAKVAAAATERVAAAEEAWTSLASFRLQLERQMVTIRIHRNSSKDF